MQHALVHSKKISINSDRLILLCAHGCFFLLQLSGRLRTLLNYDAPEFQESGIISERGDVYSFGVVMLELLTGRKPYDR